MVGGGMVAGNNETCCFSHDERDEKETEGEKVDAPSSRSGCAQVPRRGGRRTPNKCKKRICPGFRWASKTGYPQKACQRKMNTT